MMKSAPMARASDTGTGLTNPPSLSQRPSSLTGLNTPGMPMEARIDWVSGPARIQTSRPVEMSVATAPKGSLRSSMFSARPRPPSQSTIRTPSTRPPASSPTSTMDATTRQSAPTAQSRSLSSWPLA